MQVVGVPAGHEQRQDHAQQSHPGQDVEDGVERQAGGDQETAEQRAADAARADRTRRTTPRRRRGPSW